MLAHRISCLISIALCLAAFVLLCSCSALPQPSGPARPSSSSDDGTQDAGHHNAADAFAPGSISDKKSAIRPYELTLGFIGDICLADNYLPMQHLAHLGTADISQGIDPAYIERMRDEDIMWANNEFVYCDDGEPLPGKAWTFCSKTANVSYLDELGIDIVGLANNHTFDFGEKSFEATLTTLQNAGMPYVGAGWDDVCAYAPVYIERDGIKIAYVAASRAEYTVYTLEAAPDKPGIAWCYDNARFLESIREAAANADFVVALPHWGTEHSTELETAQTDGARAYIDAGADIVIGAHPHILQGIEYYKGKPILYSLGNFWFDDYDIDTVLAQVRISGEKDDGEADIGDDPQVEVRLYPGVQSGCFTHLSTDATEREHIFDELVEISPAPITISKDGVVSSL